MEMVDELLAEGRKIIIFSQFTSMLALIVERIEAAGIAYSLLNWRNQRSQDRYRRFSVGPGRCFPR